MVKILRHKHKAIRCERNGIKFPSKLERDCYDFLVRATEEDKIHFFLRQVQFDLPSAKKHFVDFCIFRKNDVIFVEAKGRDLAMGKLKREMTEQIYGIKILVVKSYVELHTFI